MNKKGFMMAEVVVVSSIIIVVLVALYISYNKIITLHNERIDYYDVPTLYRLASVRDENIETIKESFASWDLVTSEVKQNEQVYYILVSDLALGIPEHIDIKNQTFKDYLTYLIDSTEFETEYILVMERCIENDIDNCKYAYLEVF